MTPDSISKLSYLKACVKESFRMYPTASQIARLTEEPLQVSGGHVLPAHSLVLCHTHVACHQVRIFKLFYIFRGDRGRILGALYVLQYLDMEH